MEGHNTDTVDERDALIASLQQANEKLLDRAKADSQKILSLEERLKSLLNAQYGKRSERFNPDQLSLLNEAEVIAASEADQVRVIKLSA